MRLPFIIAAFCMTALPLAVQARPYLILSADETGFKALDLGNAQRTPEGPNPADHTIVNRRPAPPPVTVASRGPAGPSTGPLADPYAIPGEADEDAPPPPKTAAEIAAEKADARNDSRFLQEQIRAGRIIDDRAPVDRAAEEVDHDDLNARMMRFRPQTVAVNLIDAPAAGAEIGERLAPMIQRRVEVSCERPQWRTLQVSYLDAREKLLGEASTTGEWTDIGDDSVANTVRKAACERRYNAKAVSRFLNIGEILTNFQAAHARPVAQTKTREQLLAERYKLNH